MAAGPGNILIRVGAEAGQAVRELSTVNKSLGDTMTTSEKMGAGLRKAALPAAAALGALSVAAVGAAKAAAEDAAAQEHLAGVLERATGATERQIAAVNEWVDKTALATGVADDELRPALERIVVATKDVGKAQKIMSAALDISAASGKDLDTVSAAIAKAYTGQTAALSKLVPGLSKAAKQSKDYEVIMAELARTTGGAATDAANTAEGQYKRLTLQMSELQEELGSALLPVIEALLPVLRSFAAFAAENTTAIKILVGVVAALSAGILVANAALKAYAAVQALVKAATAAWTAAQWLLNAALTANPIGVVVVALAALVAGLVLAYKRSETFREIVHGAMDAVADIVRSLGRAFDALKAAAISAFDWIKDHWKLGLFAFGPIGAAVYLISENFDKLKTAAQKVADTFDKVADAIRRVIELVQDLLDWLGRIKVPKINLPGPFSLGAAATSTAGAPSARAGARSSSSSGVTVNVYGSLDPEGTARAVARVLRQHDRRQGRLVEGA